MVELACICISLVDLKRRSRILAAASNMPCVFPLDGSLPGTVYNYGVLGSCLILGKLRELINRGIAGDGERESEREGERECVCL